MRCLSPFLLLILLPVTLWAQRPDVGESVRFIEAWRTQQQQAATGVRAVAFVEHADQEMDSPRGVRRSESEVALRAFLAEDRIERQTRRIVLEGRALPSDEMERWEHRTARMLQPFHEASRWFLAPPVRLWNRLEPVSTPQPDPVRRANATRIEFRANRPDAPLDRLTAWFSPDGRRLLRTRMLYQMAPDAPPLQVTTEYERVQGLDLPARQWLDGTMRYRRRTRTYTVLLDIDARFTDHVIERR